MKEKKIALQIEKEWKTISKEKITNVGFSEWYAGNLSYQLSKEQSDQNTDIRNTMVTLMSLVRALNEASEVDQVDKDYNYNNVKGEA